MLAFRQARFGAGRSLCCVNDFGVTLGRNLGLCNDDLIADRAVLALSLAGFGAGRLNCRINDLGMSLGGDHFLRNEYSIADGAVLTLGQASLRAGWSLCCIDYFCVAGRGDLFHTGYRSAADGALRTSFMTGLGAGSGLFHNFNRSMSSRLDCFGLGFRADRAGVGLDAGFLAGGSGRDLALIPAVALGGNLFLRFDNRSADRAADAIRQTRFGTGCGLAHNGLLGVASRGNHFLRNKNFVADGAVLALGLAGFRAGRLDPCVNDLGMALGRNGLALLDYYYFTNRADRITGVAGLGAGGFLLVDHLGDGVVVLPLGVKSGVLGQINSRAIRIGVASTVSRRIPVQEVVAFTSEGVCIQRRILLCGHSLRRHRAFDRVFRTSVGFKGNRQLHRLFAAPNAIDIVDNIASLGVLRLIVGVVKVVQLGGGDGDVHLTAARIILIGCSRLAGCALLNVLAGAIAGADIRTALGGVDGANRRYAAVYINLSVFKVCICAVVHLARRIRHGLKLAGAPDKVIAVPLIAVVNIYIFAI